MNAPEGVYWRSEPNWAAAVRVTGFGVYNGTVVEVHCYQSGTSVEGSADTMWEQATDVGGPGYGSGWLNEHFINDGQPINEHSPGVPPCGSAPPPSPPAPAPGPASGLVFSVLNAEGGIYYREGPHWNEAIETPGVGVYNGDQVELICGAFGDAVGPYNDTAWSKVRNLTRPSIGEGWVNEHFINDGAPDNGFVAGEPMCQPGVSGSTGAGSSGGGGPSLFVNANYNRDGAVAWALAHAKDSQPRLSMCAWFVSHALWAGGLPKVPGVWTDQGSYGHIATGTADEWLAPNLEKYLASKYTSTFTNITPNLKTNAVPQAEEGDLIFYDWGEGDGISHVAIVVGIAPGSYPEVAEMGQYDFHGLHVVGNLINPVNSNYQKRGWTWSQVHHGWLQKEHPHMKAYLFHFVGGSQGDLA